MYTGPHPRWLIVGAGCPGGAAYWPSFLALTWTRESSRCVTMYTPNIWASVPQSEGLCIDAALVFAI